MFFFRIEEESWVMVSHMSLAARFIIQDDQPLTQADGSELVLANTFRDHLNIDGQPLTEWEEGWLAEMRMAALRRVGQFRMILTEEEKAEDEEFLRTHVPHFSFGASGRGVVAIPCRYSPQWINYCGVKYKNMFACFTMKTKIHFLPWGKESLDLSRKKAKLLNQHALAWLDRLNRWKTEGVEWCDEYEVFRNLATFFVTVQQGDTIVCHWGEEE